MEAVIAVGGRCNPRTQPGPPVSGISGRVLKATWVKLSVGLGP